MNNQQTKKYTIDEIFENIKYKTVSIKVAKNGWIVEEKGEPTEIFVRWDDVIKKLEKELTSKGDLP